MSPTPPAEARHHTLVDLLQAGVRWERERVRRSGYWPSRNAWQARQRRWPLFLKDPEQALVHLYETLNWSRFAGDDAVTRAGYTRPEVRAAARVVVTALALEDA